MENNIMFASRIGITFYFYGISKERKELIKEVFGQFNRITNFRFKYYYSTGNWKKINKSTDILTIFNNNIDKYTDYFEDVNIINFTDESEIQMSNISFEMYLIDDMEIQWPSYIYCELPFMDIKLIRTYMINTFNILHCQYACANPVISYNTHISKSFTKSMKYLLNTKIYSSKFSIYTNHFLLANMKAKNRIVQFKGLDGVNFIQIYSIDWFHMIKKDFIDKAEKKDY